MTAPISGTVAEVPFAVGETAGTDDAVVIIGGGGVQIQMAVPEAAFNTLEIGQRATITTPGGGRAVGTVSARGLLPTESTSGSSSSTDLPGDRDRLRPGGEVAAGRGHRVGFGEPEVEPRCDRRPGLRGDAERQRRRRPGAEGRNGDPDHREARRGRRIHRRDPRRALPGETLVLADNTTALPTNSSNRGLRAGGGGPPAGATQVGGGAIGGR